ncbi:beta strand repeat-containing protein [Granulicella cerasi]|uniref:Beta strand repeat-containing protein n=1 Tax=Granulicella cerasi TaxID=741063 RepID=A0ABW1Z816_9BACT|nr:Ig domain-containing protein [Granulicella cerasi]
MLVARRSRSIFRVIFPCLAMLAALGMASCSDGGTGSASLVALFLSSSTLSMDTGQTGTITAKVTNDKTPGGVTFTVAGGGTLGTQTTSISGQTKTITVPYTAPTTATSATVTATSIAAPSQAYSVTITVTAAPVITTTTLATGVVGTAYNVTPASTGGTGTLTWSISSGTLPAGLSLNAATGAITGTPTTAGSATFTLALTDSAPTPVTAVQTLTLTVNAQPPVVTPATLPSGITGTAYSQQLAYTGGGTGTATWAATGSLPPGISLSASGLLSGTPTTTGTYTFSTAVTVGAQTSASVSFTITVVAPVVITTTSLPSAHVNVAYSQQLTYSGGSGTPTWSIVSGSLPSTMTLSSSGVLSGTPTSVSNYTIGVAVKVGTQTSATQSLTFSVVSTQITSAATATGEVGFPFRFQVTAIGGTSPYTFAVASSGSALPAGLSINSATGVISGTPTTNTGSPFANVIVQATDTQGATGTQAMTFTINASRGSAANSELNGQYAFELSGFDVNGVPLAKVGSFTVDGNGHVTTGVMDTNGTALSAATTNAALIASTYAVGADGRGQITLTSAAGSISFALATSGLSNSVASAGSLVEIDATGARLTGRFARQTTANFTLAANANGYALGLAGWSAGSTATALTKAGLVGELQLASTGAVSSSEWVTAASSTPVVSTSGAFTLNTNGRGTLTLVSASGTTHFAVYVVSASQWMLLSTDAAASGGQALLVGDTTMQTIANGSFATASLLGTSVFSESKLGVSSAQAYFPDVQIGLLSFDGAGGITGSQDRSANGAFSQGAVVGTYTVATNGRANVKLAASGLSGCIDCSGTNYVFYFASANAGYYLDYATSGGQGTLEAQVSNATVALSGTYALSTRGPITATVVPESGLVTVSGAAVTALLDQVSASATTPDVSTSSTAATASTGRVVLTGGNPAVLYLTAAGHALWLDSTQATPVVRELNAQ